MNSKLIAELENSGAILWEKDTVAIADLLRRAAALIERQAAEIEKLREALEMYADPAFYHGCAFMFDRPTGGFDEDFSLDHGDENYDYEKPGKLARAALAATEEKK